jgi:hypothetical protein
VRLLEKAKRPVTTAPPHRPPSLIFTLILNYMRISKQISAADYLVVNLTTILLIKGFCYFIHSRHSRSIHLKDDVRQFEPTRPVQHSPSKTVGKTRLKNVQTLYNRIFLPSPVFMLLLWPTEFDFVLFCPLIARD